MKAANISPIEKSIQEGTHAQSKYMSVNLISKYVKEIWGKN
jgi:hypothetical protein